MKKIILFLVVCFIFPYGAKAVSVTVDYQDNIYSHRETWNHHYSGKLGYIYLDDKIAYCINPFKIIGNNYTVDDTVLSSIDLDYSKLVAHYGYQTHLDNIYYYLATQELIWWENRAAVRLYWTTENTTDSNRIIIDSYKEEIKNNVERARIKPNFGTNILSGDYGDIIIFDDQNAVLKDYEIINNSKNEIWKEENKLYVRVLESGTFKLMKKIKSGVSTNGYNGGSSNQALATFSIDEEIIENIDINMNSYKSKIKITRYANNKKVEGKIKFKIYDVKKGAFIEQDKIFETDEQGNFISDFKLDKGTYEIYNMEIPYGYIFSEQITSFEIKDDNELKNYIFEIDDYLDVPIGQINIENFISYSNYKIPVYTKYYFYADSNIYDEKYKLIYKKGELVKETTDVKVNLPLGKYKVISDDNFYIVELLYQDSITKYIIKEIKWEKTFQPTNIFIKTNLNTCDNEKCEIKPIDDLIYDLYAKDDIYLENKLIYKKDEFIYRIFGNQKKEILLIDGEYYIKEVKNDYNYPMEDYFFHYTSNDISLDITKYKIVEKKTKPILEEITAPIENNDETIIKKENANNYILPNTDNYLKKYIYCSLGMIIIGIIMIKYDFFK